MTYVIKEIMKKLEREKIRAIQESEISLEEKKRRWEIIIEKAKDNDEKTEIIKDLSFEFLILLLLRIEQQQDTVLDDLKSFFISKGYSVVDLLQIVFSKFGLSGKSYILTQEWFKRLLDSELQVCIVCGNDINSNLFRKIEFCGDEMIVYFCSKECEYHFEMRDKQHKFLKTKSQKNKVLTMDFTSATFKSIVYKNHETEKYILDIPKEVIEQINPFGSNIFCTITKEKVMEDNK